VGNPALFYALAAVSTSFAGFAGLYLALRPQNAAWKAYEVNQVKTIILYALTTLFGSLLLLPMADLIGESLALRVMSAGVLVIVFYGHQVRSETSWTRWPKVRQDLSRRELIIQMAPFVLVAVADQVMLLANLVAPTVGLYQLALILILATPALVFVTVVSRFGSSTEKLTTSPCDLRRNGPPAATSPTGSRPVWRPRSVGFTSSRQPRTGSPSPRRANSVASASATDVRVDRGLESVGNVLQRRSGLRIPRISFLDGAALVRQCRAGGRKVGTAPSRMILEEPCERHVVELVGHVTNGANEQGRTCARSAHHGLLALLLT
jgi:hypothetical protein